MAVRGEETEQLEAADAAAVDAARKLGAAKSFRELPETGDWLNHVMHALT